MRGKRNKKLEEKLQKTLDDGNKVWVIGDVHGHHEALEDLIQIIEPSESDHIVILGDLIDRGPDSFQVIRTVRTNNNIHSIKGNHEAMMLEHFDVDYIERPGYDMLRFWYYNGGKDTVESYMREYLDDEGEIDTFAMKRQVAIDMAFVNDLPDHIVLRKWRLVHAGYDPKEPDLDLQSSEKLHWIRTPFHNATEPLDTNRCVVYGHTPVMNFGLTQDNVKNSPVKLEDGRPISIGIDTCAYGGDSPTLTAICLNDSQIIQARVRD